MHRSPLQALVTAVACAAGAVLVWAATFHLTFAARLDEATLNGFMGLRGPRTEGLADTLTSLVDPRPFAVFSLALVLVAVARGRPRHAVAVGVVLAGANVTTQILKPALAQPRLDALDLPNGVALASWPSGHTTAAMSLALCLVLVSPSRLRPLAATIGGVFAVAVVYGILLLGWHYPSDILGGFLVATGWTFLGLAALRAADRRWPEGRGREAAKTTWGPASGDRSATAPRSPVTSGTPGLADALRPTAAAAAGLAALAGVVALARLEWALDYARDNTTFFAGATVIGLSGLALAAGLAAVLRR